MTEKKHLSVVSVLFIILSVGLASSLSLIGGIGIELVSEKLLPIIPLVIIFPALNSLVGDYATLIAAHAGSTSKHSRSKKELVRAMAPSLVVNYLFIIAMGLILVPIETLTSQARLSQSTCYLLRWSIITVIAVMFVLTYALDRLLQRRALNPVMFLYNRDDDI